MTDFVKLLLIAGRGGDGKVSFRREKYVPKGGPDGGDGGDGGNIIIRGNRNLATLKDFAGKIEFKAPDGQRGGKKKMSGAKGESIVLEVPLGTQISLIGENQLARHRRMALGLGWQVRKSDLPAYLSARKYELEKEGGGVVQSADDRPQPDETGLEYLPSEITIFELTEHNQEAVVCQGGFGGRGNVHFKSSTRTTPLIAERGTVGEIREVAIELKLLADVGLVGLPNAGKSTFLSVVTSARPKIANYPFTTLEPNLGIMTVDDQGNGRGRELVVADLPGLIEGASQGKGLGHDFLRHIENCSVLLYVLYLNEEDVFGEVGATDETGAAGEVGADDQKTTGQQLVDQKLADQLWQQFLQLQLELSTHNQLLSDKPFIVGVNKSDLYSPALVTAITKTFKKHRQSVVIFSGITGSGLDQIKRELLEFFKAPALE